jgi:hypothetical protein
MRALAPEERRTSPASWSMKRARSREPGFLMPNLTNGHTSAPIMPVVSNEEPSGSGDQTFEVPQVRCGRFYPSALGGERAPSGRSSRTGRDVRAGRLDAKGHHRAASAARAGSGDFIHPGQSRRRAARCRPCRLTGKTAWRNPYVLLDARYERVREAGRLIDCAVLVAIGTASKLGVGPISSVGTYPGNGRIPDLRLVQKLDSTWHTQLEAVPHDP